MLELVLSVLMKNDLFSISKYEVYGFLKTEDSKTPDSLKKIECNSVNTHDMRSVFMINKKDFDEIEIDSFIFYFDTNVVLGNQKIKTFKDTFIVEMNTSIINLITDFDIWLPYDLRGKQQKLLASLNAFRLENVLLEIEKKVGEKLISDNTEYAIVSGYKLENIRDTFNEVMNVYD